jgi:hypothetical protein
MTISKGKTTPVIMRNNPNKIIRPGVKNLIYTTNTTQNARLRAQIPAAFEYHITL